LSEVSAGAMALGPPDVATRRVRLRIVTPADTPFLYTLSTAPEASYRWRYRGGTPSTDQFAHDLWQGVLAQFLLIKRDSGEPVGLLVAYQADLANRTCYFALLGDLDGSDPGLMLEGALLFITYLFHTWDLRQVYAEVPGYTLDSFASGMGRYFVEEGRLVEHSFHAGRYWDLHLLAIHREAWLKATGPLLDVLVGGDGGDGAA
jgi:RimJ/RimL family protein N-acetyltransferase